ncbi:metal ABC transporter solute-binding protein, Zn/Mn family [Paenibacillus sp. SGZ-1009]|uniref:metal ABC transporter solute-binding protein, Zn/Mn family n=1 Tax=Paenibacillus campi TaxID=3106031 RepID=UPI002AFF67DC|nr:zinc ABC transporter substrate-binding protein [Paenibacillus sp. SGZ-1009]
MITIQHVLSACKRVLDRYKHTHFLYVRSDITIAGLFMLLILPGCTGEQAAGQSDAQRLHITATTGMIADAAEQIGGSYVHVTGLMGPGVDPHTYKASQGDIRKLDDAELVLYNGLHLEGSMTKILAKMSRSRHVVAVTDRIDRAALRQSDEYANEHDPHIWFDVSLWSQAVERIRDAMIEADPQHAAIYRSNANAYIQQLQQLHRHVQQQIATIPEPSRVLVTAHDAFGYYGAAYGLEVRGLQGLSTASEYGSRDVAQLRNMLIQRQIKAVFAESSIPARAMEAVIAGAAEQGHTVTLGGQLYSDALGKQGGAADTYIDMVKHNTHTIVQALR